MSLLAKALKMIKNTTFCPIKKNMVLFNSFLGHYNDNPKYISEELHRQYPDIHIAWVVAKGYENEFPDYVEKVYFGSDKYYKYISCCEVVVDNHIGDRSWPSIDRVSFKNVIKAWSTRRRKGQLNISTWHGVGLKHIYLDEPRYQSYKHAKFYSCSNMLIAGCDLMVKIYKSAFKWDRPILMCGSPRNDILFEENRNDYYKQKLNLPLDKKVILFAPTFRDDVDNSGINQVKEMDYDLLFEALKNQFGGDWCFVFRSHNRVMEVVKKHSDEFDSRIINGNEFPDMAEYLCAADVLLTDYSSSMFDYMLTGKPCFLYTPDIENYKNADRGFYFDVEETPFPLAVRFEELIDKIVLFDSAKYVEDVDVFLSYINNIEDGTASMRIVALIKEHIVDKIDILT